MDESKYQGAVKQAVGIILQNNLETLFIYNTPAYFVKKGFANDVADKLKKEGIFEGRYAYDTKVYTAKEFYNFTGVLSPEPNKRLCVLVLDTGRLKAESTGKDCGCFDLEDFLNIPAQIT